MIKRLVLELDSAFHHKFKTICIQRGMSMREIMFKLLKEFMKDDQKYKAQKDS